MVIILSFWKCRTIIFGIEKYKFHSKIQVKQEIWFNLDRFGAEFYEIKQFHGSTWTILQKLHTKIQNRT